jgi:hypothetical protein
MYFVSKVFVAVTLGTMLGGGAFANAAESACEDLPAVSANDLLAMPGQDEHIA